MRLHEFDLAVGHDESEPQPCDCEPDCPGAGLVFDKHGFPYCRCCGADLPWQPWMGPLH